MYLGRSIRILARHILRTPCLQLLAAGAAGGGDRDAIVDADGYDRYDDADDAAARCQVPGLANDLPSGSLLADGAHFYI